MPTVQPGLNVKSLAEVAWLVARLAPGMIQTHSTPPSTALREFWQSNRALQQHWDEFLDVQGSTIIEQTRFEEVATQLFTTEMLARVWATLLGRLDEETGGNDLTRIAANSVSGLLQIRNRLVSCLLLPEVPPAWGAEMDRLRRRCDRWTDLLIGKVCGGGDYFQFAMNPDRARDFAEEARAGDPCAPSVELLVAAGVRLSFLGQLPEIGFDSPAFERLIQSILRCLPEVMFDQNGTLRIPSPSGADQAGSKDSDGCAVSCADNVLIPGISLDNLKRRFK